jgi:large subunit ribosomal protein L22
MPKYAIESDPDKSAKAYGFEIHCSHKDSMNIAYALKDMDVKRAKEFLEDVINLKKPIPTIFHNRKRAHQKGIGSGSFPQKAAKNILKVIENAENNAEYKGFDVDNMKISHISAYRGRKIRGIMPRAHGRATDKNEITTNIEVVIEEVE